MSRNEEQLAEALNTASRVVEESTVPDDLRSTAFRLVLEHLIQAEMTPSPALDVGDDPPQSSPAPESADPLARISARLKVPIELLQEVFYISEGNVELILPSSKFAKSKKGGARQISLLVAAGRQAGGIDAEWTPFSILREACDRFGKFDSSNFAYDTSQMDDVFHIRGKQQSKEVRVRVPGYEAASQLITQLITES